MKAKAEDRETTAAATSITRFCQTHDISRGHFYALHREGKGPKVMRVGRRRLISQEAAAAWRRRMEREGA